MRKVLNLISTMAVFSLIFVNISCASPVEDSLKKSYPNIKPEKVSESVIKGMYEIAVEGKVIYYHPESDLVFVGNIIRKDGTNLTQESVSKLISNKVKNLDLSQAVKIGNGPKRVIEITDPDCPYCRKASEFLSKRNDITRYIFLYPLPIHKDAESKIKYILGSTDKSKAYEEAMSGKLDDMKFKINSDKSIDALLNKHKEVFSKLGLSGTPFFVIDNNPVFGADTKKMEEFLK